ncbi:hypothetical protein ACFL5W_01630 [Thermodesulfobacteriota bacterium]
MCSKVLETIAICLAFGGALLMAFGLKIKSGIAEDLKSEMNLEEKNLYAPSDVKQNIPILVIGLTMIFFAAVIQVIILWFF